MATAKQCDRCGKFYPFKAELLGPSECEKCKKETLCSGECLKKYVNVNSFFDKSICVYLDSRKGSIDICQECMDSLKNGGIRNKRRTDIYEYDCNNHNGNHMFYSYGNCYDHM